MTRLRKSVTRLTGVKVFDGGQDRFLVVTLDPLAGIVLRQEGTRHRLTLPLKAAWQYAARLEAERTRAERLKGGRRAA